MWEDRFLKATLLSQKISYFLDIYIKHVFTINGDRYVPSTWSSLFLHFFPFQLMMIYNRVSNFTNNELHNLMFGDPSFQLFLRFLIFHQPWMIDQAGSTSFQIGLYIYIYLLLILARLILRTLAMTLWSLSEQIKHTPASLVYNLSFKTLFSMMTYYYYYYINFRHDLIGNSPMSLKHCEFNY